MDRWAEIEVFLRTAEAGSLTRAAEALDMSVSAVSRHLHSLEERLNVRLLQRSTRRMYLTEEGEIFYAKSKDVLANMKEVEADVSGKAFKPSGTLRVSASLSFCLMHLVPLMPEFRRRYPDVTVDIHVSNRYYDLIENGVDVAIRTRRLEADSSITIRHLAETRRLLAASPEYIAKHGIPHLPFDLKSHHLLLYTLADYPNILNFTRGNESVTLSVDGVISSNDGQVIRSAALRGLGILVQPAYIIHDDIATGKLVRVMSDWDLPRLTMNIAFPTRVHLPAKVRLFIDFLAANFRVNDYEALWTQ